MNVAIVGGGPAGLYLAIQLKRLDPSHAITVHERNRPEDTYGFGVVFSDATMEDLAAADPETFARLASPPTPSAPCVSLLQHTDLTEQTEISTRRHRTRENRQGVEHAGPPRKPPPPPATVFVAMPVGVVSVFNC